MKVSLIVVQGKPEGKVIPLAVPRFRIGRGEGCHLRPNNEQVSRNHAEIEIGETTVILRDLGSRNGTFVNNEQLEAKADHVLKNKDLVQIGPLTFAVSIQGAPVPAAAQPTDQDKVERALTKDALDELSHEDIDAWLVTDQDSPAAPERPSGVYTGDTMTFSSFKEAEASKSDPDAAVQSGSEVAPPAPEAEAARPEPAADTPPEDEIYDKLDDEEDLEGGGEEPLPEQFIDESNPFYAAKKEGEEEPAPKKAEEVDSSRAAEDILRKMMERRRATR